MADPTDIATFLQSMDEADMAHEVLSMHNRLEAFASGLDRDCMKATQKAFDDVLKQRDNILAVLEKIVTETMDYPPKRPSSSDSWIPRELVSEAQAAIMAVRGHPVPTYKDLATEQIEKA